jgi:hypothetical protein
MADAGSSSSDFATRRARPGRRLIGHGSEPLHQVRLEQAAQRHQHQADRAVAADEILLSGSQRVLDHIEVDRVKDDDRILFHAQGGRRIYPVAPPARGAQFRKDFGGVIAALAGNDGIHRLQFGDVLRVLQRRALRLSGRLAADVGGSEKHRLE